ncbi:secretogranin-1 isoform X1 [Cygnus olor]|uniref:secretogranin-1 isoform X1 n=2 Tax=Cygnus olor TaxID=8869 RepID=UPI001ADE6EF0|nr:secretogranin-1 isoform X1 [Cygnus olor]XP_040408618.1 secretogranin-1 isoform X1 [Cygnus olor]XP_040408619.1 secretogranin-1 isoform X1 [Cygnus olor]
MEGKETSPSHHSEESSISDLPSVCDLAEIFQPPSSAESSEEPFCSPDTFPSPLPGVSAVPVEKDHMEEMVTRCIVEVLSNALSKLNAPPINPECKEILKKSGKNDRERSEEKQLEARHLKDPAEMEKHLAGGVEKEQSQVEDDSRKHMKGSGEGKVVPEEGKSKEEEEGHHIPVNEERLHTEEKKHYQEIRREEENSYHSEEESKESKHHDGEVDRAVLNKKSNSADMGTEEFPEGNDQRPVGHWHLEEGMQSPYKRIHGGEEGEAEEERSEKYHHESKVRDFAHQQEHEESDESEEAEEEKQPYKPKHSHGKHGMDDSSEEKRGHGGEKEELAEESNAEETRLWDRRNHRQKHHREESEQQREEKSGYRGRHGSEEVEEKRHAGQGSAEYRERWQQSEESSEEESKRHHHGEESDEKWREEKRHHDGSHEARRHHSEGRTYRGGESEEELDRYHSGGSKERQHRAGGRYRLWDNEDEEIQKAYAQERRGQARTHYSTEDSVEQQRYPGNSEEEEEEVEKKHYSSDQMENEEENMEEGRYGEGEEYRSHLPAENDKRTAASYSSLYPLLWWKSRHFEKRNSAGERLLESKEESRPTLNEKNLFPDYTDYDWWEKKQLLSALNHGRSEKRNLGKMNRYDMKRQYNKMDQLAQLLNYRKKSAEFPELYSSGEDMKKRHIVRNDKGALSQRPLTEEEEKELENLAAMDLEMQKIAETLNDNRRG